MPIACNRSGLSIVAVIRRWTNTGLKSYNLKGKNGSKEAVSSQNSHYTLHLSILPFAYYMQKRIVKKGTESSRIGYYIVSALPYKWKCTCTPIKVCIFYFSVLGRTTDGIFRISGQTKVVDRMRHDLTDRLNRNPTADLTSVFGTYDIPSIAQLLKVN